VFVKITQPQTHCRISLVQMRAVHNYVKCYAKVKHALIERSSKKGNYSYLLILFYVLVEEMHYFSYPYLSCEGIQIIWIKWYYMQIIFISESELITQLYIFTFILLHSFQTIIKEKNFYFVFVLCFVKYHL
jgi:hypothetical protein